MIDFKTLMQRAHATSVTHGWYDEPDGSTLQLMSNGVPNVPRILERHALIHSELSEAWIEWKNKRMEIWYASTSRKPEGFVVEIADAVIRIADLLEACEIEPSNLNPLNTVDRWRDDPVQTQMRIRGSVDDSTELIRKGRVMAWARELEFCVHVLSRLCNNLDLDLQSALATKLEYNETRPYRHGGKLA